MRGILFLVGIIAFVSPLRAQTPAPSASPVCSATALEAGPSLEQRVADLEAYVNNSARGADTGSGMASNLAGPGPGPNSGMMTCAALVVFFGSSVCGCLPSIFPSRTWCGELMDG